MNLAIFLALGDSFKKMAQSGQDESFKKFYLSAFSKNFENVYVFSYDNENVRNIPKNVIVVPNRWSVHRYIYSVISPLVNRSILSQCQVVRAYHISGTIPAIILKIFFNKPFVFNYAYNYFEFARIENKKLQYYLFKIIQPIAIFFSSKILAANKKIFQFLPKSKSIYHPNGISTQFFKPWPVKKGKNRSQILFVGRLEKQKNLENLLKAVSGLNLDIKIIGKGSLKKSLLTLAKNSEINLKITDKVKNTSLPKIYSQSDIFVLPSLIEGHPKVLLEAMSCGLPVVATKVEGTKDIIVNNKTGIESNPDPESLRLSILKLLRNSKLSAKIGLSARKFIVENFDLSELLKQEIKVIKRIGENKK